MDAVVLSWIYGAVTTEIMDSVRVRGGTARQAWLGIEAQFLGNSETRALRLDAEFRTFSQGELSVSDYCRQMKSMAAKLRDLGEVINDRTLVLNVLRGLNDKFGHMRIHFRRGPFSSFDEVRNELLLEELITGTPASSSSSALLANAPKSSGMPAPPAPSTGGPASTPTGSGPQPRSTTTASSGTSNRRRRRNKGNSPWLSLYNPWTGKITMWPNQGGDTGHQQGQQRPPPQQNAPNPRAGNPQTAQAFQQAQAYQQAMLAAYVQQQQVPRPPSPQWQQAYYQQQPPVQPPAPPLSSTWTPWSGGWDQQHLANNFSTMTLTPPQHHRVGRRLRRVRSHDARHR